MAEPSTAKWEIEHTCCWCGAGFVRETIYNGLTYTCVTPACRDRQLAHVMLDANENLFHLPTPKGVMLEEAVECQRYRFICIGGHRSGGKSIELRRIAQQCCLKYEEFSVLFLRRTFPELIRNHVKRAAREAKRLSKTKDSVKVASNKMTFAETDSEIEFGHVCDLDDYKGYIGSDVDLIVFDQLEEFTEEQFSEICVATGRAKRPDWRGLVLAGENPGGPLSAFVDERFVTKTCDRKKYPEYNPALYHFIESTLSDNPHSSEDYTDMLAGLSEERREMFRYGRRDVFPSQFFGHFNPALHVRPA